MYEKAKRKQNKQKEVQNNVRMEMRRLGRLYLHFCEIRKLRGVTCDPESSAADMLIRQNFSDVEVALEKCTTCEDAED